MTSGTESQFPPAEIHPFLEASTTPIATTASTAVAVSAILNTQLSHERRDRGSARLILSFDNASGGGVPTEEDAMRHLGMNIPKTIILGSVAQTTR
jgi:hypothetical protein